MSVCLRVIRPMWYFRCDIFDALLKRRHSCYSYYSGSYNIKRAAAFDTAIGYFSIRSSLLLLIVYRHCLFDHLTALTVIISVNILHNSLPFSENRTIQRICVIWRATSRWRREFQSISDARNARPRSRHSSKSWIHAFFTNSYILLEVGWTIWT